MRAPMFWSAVPLAPSPYSLFRLKDRLRSISRSACQCSNCALSKEETPTSHCLNRAAGPRQRVRGFVVHRQFVELDELRLELAAFYSTMGRPSIDPELMIRMLIVGYCFGIRSERRLC